MTLPNVQKQVPTRRILCLVPPTPKGRLNPVAFRQQRSGARGCSIAGVSGTRREPVGSGAVRPRISYSTRGVANCQDGAGGVADHFFCDAAENGLGDEAAAVGAHDDQVHAMIFGKFDDLRERMAVQPM